MPGGLRHHKYARDLHLIANAKGLTIAMPTRYKQAYLRPDQVQAIDVTLWKQPRRCIHSQWCCTQQCCTCLTLKRRAREVRLMQGIGQLCDRLSTPLTPCNAHSRLHEDCVLVDGHCTQGPATAYRLTDSGSIGLTLFLAALTDGHRARPAHRTLRHNSLVLIGRPAAPSCLSIYQ
jgi:hypothetical protein